MNGIRVKICGLTSAADARLAVSLGADYLGVVFAESPRRVSIDRAREIRAAVPSATLVGVFKDQPLPAVIETTLACSLDLVQLHGDEDPAYCDEVLRDTGKPVVKAFRALRVPGASELASFRTTSYFLFDLDRDGAPPAADIERAWEGVADARRKGFRMFVAGGIDAANVKEILDRTHAFGVDVCRGVESAPGVKDPLALARFLMEARA
jgi:phosphoribosylanthranilate isomerase